MAATGDLMADVDLGLKTDFHDVFVKQIYTRSHCLQKIKKHGKRRTLGGRSGQAVWAVDAVQAMGMSIHDEAGDFGTPRPDRQKNYSIQGVRKNFIIEISGDVIAYAKKTDASYLGNFLKRKMKGILSAAQWYYAGAVMANGDSQIAQIASGGVSGNVLTLDDPGVRWLRKGDYVTIRPATSSGAEQLTGGDGSGEIVDIDRNAGTITLANAAGAAPADYVYREGTYDTSTGGKTTVNGLRNLIDTTGTVQGVNRATAGNGFAKAFVLDNGAAALTENDFMELNDEIEDHSFSGDPKGVEFITDSPSVRTLFAVIDDRHRFTSNDTMDVGFGKLRIHTTHGPRELHADPMCYPGDVYRLDWSQFIMFEPQGEEGGVWFDKHGSSLLPLNAASGQGYADGYQAVRVCRMNIGLDEFASQGVLRNFT